MLKWINQNKHVTIQCLITFEEPAEEHWTSSQKFQTVLKNVFKDFIRTSWTFFFEMEIKNYGDGFVGVGV